jgi:hypothetical protein
MSSVLQYVLSHSSQAGAMPAHIIGTLCTKLSNGCNLIAFDYLFQFIMSLFVHRGNINSTCVNIMRVSLLNGTATAQLKDGSVYHYTNVSRRAIAKFLMDDARSLGKFFNYVCQAARTKCTAIDNMFNPAWA